MKSTKPFRLIKKELPGGQIPVKLSRKLRRLAGEHRRSISSVLTEAVARGLGEDPNEYGIPTQPTNAA